MKKAFTLLELVIVIVVIGILAAVAIPRVDSNKLNEAAIQLVSHIRYTQHLAMVDDKYDSDDGVWYKKRWQILFASTVGSGNAWAYTIFSDSLGFSTGTPDVDEHAVNPLNPSKFLTGGYSAGNIAFDDARATEELNLGNKYGITSIALSASCSISPSTRIAFDHLGRPLRGAFHSYTTAYPAADRLVTQPCNITLTSSEGNIVIAIEPETGYTHIL